MCIGFPEGQKPAKKAGFYAPQKASADRKSAL
jgi:hypothetical protein